MTPFFSAVTVSFHFAMDYKDTLNLPRTDFAMKADLIAREPERLKKWEAARLYEQIAADYNGPNNATAALDEFCGKATSISKT